MTAPRKPSPAVTRDHAAATMRAEHLWELAERCVQGALEEADMARLSDTDRDLVRRLADRLRGQS